MGKITPSSDKKRPLSHPKYRPDIDGLRAIAVLAVVGFHAFPKSFRGGYVGVDVFFVISGFLISSIIFKSFEQGSFSFTEFYARRIKRIFPALFVVLTACYVMGWSVLLADEFEQLCKHIAAGAGFVANLILWSEAGYFDNAAETKPLLHLWSLGIEEQFYIVWPLLLYLGWRWHLNLLWLTLIVLVTSFIFNVSTIGSDAVAAFYSPLSRFWELLIGSSLAYLTLHRHNTLSRLKTRICAGVGIPLVSDERGSQRTALRDAISILGVGLIAAAMFGLRKNSLFPGWWALLPTLGTLLLISAGPDAWLNRKVLSHRVLIWIGLISYPLYLWHWPLLTFARILESRTPSQGIRIAAVITSIALAWLTYRLVETPVRHNGKRLVTIFLALMSIPGGVGLLTLLNEGFPSESRPLRPITERGLTQDLTCVKHFGDQLLFNYCKSNSKQSPLIAVIGDSHAQSLYDGLIKQFGTDRSVILAAHTGCPPLSGTDVYPTKKTATKKNCHRIYQQILTFIEKRSVNTVFLIGRGPFYLNGGPGPRYSIERPGAGSSSEAYYLGLREIVVNLSGRAIFLLIENPRFDHTPLECTRKFRFSGRCKAIISRAAHDNEQTQYRKIIERIAKEFKNLTVLDPTDYFCDENICSQTIAGINLYADKHHLSKIGGEQLVEYFISRKHLGVAGLTMPATRSH